ncbi:hypothetical protein FIBSPDRAFT_138 [Athelia psychrophila]|uniref:Uncharacterized protein n=1 Tax=Athelia psychrophila TaxID=1759441 RepID=A0A166WV56_9AGAM|nr:hypothetical protein FIBSPDRAFT_138 [Fibularhizoctonia sp. CBS 109695]
MKPSTPARSSPGDEPASPVSWVLSDVPPPSKRRRVSISSFSDADGDDHEENKPLAARMSLRTTPVGSWMGTSRRSNWRRNWMRVNSTAWPMASRLTLLTQTCLSSLLPLFDLPLTPQCQPPVKGEKAAITELRKGIIQITPVENDGQPRSIVILTGLKILFQKQLPKMPREYIARLVCDSNS